MFFHQECLILSPQQLCGLDVAESQFPFSGSADSRRVPWVLRGVNLDPKVLGALLLPCTMLGWVGRLHLQLNFIITFGAKPNITLEKYKSQVSK